MPLHTICAFLQVLLTLAPCALPQLLSVCHSSLAHGGLFQSSLLETISNDDSSKEARQIPLEAWEAEARKMCKRITTWMLYMQSNRLNHSPSSVTSI